MIFTVILILKWELNFASLVYLFTLQYTLLFVFLFVFKQKKSRKKICILISGLALACLILVIIILQVQKWSISVELDMQLIFLPWDKPKKWGDRGEMEHKLIFH